MKQQPSSVHVVCTFCQQNVLCIPIFVCRYFFVIPPKVCVCKISDPPQPVMALPFTAGRGSAGLMGPKHCPHLSCLDLLDTLHRHLQLPSCMDKWAFLPCQSRPSCVGVGSPFSQILFHSWLHKVGLPQHLSSHIKTRGI